MRALLKFSASLKLAVIVIILLSLALAAGTIVESLFDLPTAWYWVYRTWWFYAILSLLGINILAVALSRIPWKRRHTPFLLAHAGILMLLIGSWITQQWGIDGSLVVSEGQASPFVELEDRLLTLRSKEKTESYRVPWIPPNARFQPIQIPEWNLAISDYLSHGEPVYEFGPSKESNGTQANEDRGLAIQVRLKGGPMPMSRDFWLWLGDPQWSVLPLGPAKVILHAKGKSWEPDVYDFREMGRIEFREKSGTQLEYRASTRSGKLKTGVIALRPGTQPVVETGFMALSLQILRWEPEAVNRSTYSPSRRQYGDQAPPSAIQIHSGSTKVWLGEGDQAILSSQGEPVEAVYFRKRIVLPFQIRLKKFSIEYYDGSRSPKSYQSEIEIVGGSQSGHQAIVSMNEPLDWDGFTFYQSSYIPGEPRPTTSIFSVNRDPGRELKYWGSILLILGSTLLFAVKYAKSGWVKRFFT